MTLYIAGPITGVVDYKKYFSGAEERLEAAGFGTINPAALPHEDPQNWVACMRLDIPIMIQNADGLALLPGWIDSKGAWLEVTIARALNMPIQHLENWLGQRSTLHII